MSLRPPGSRKLASNINRVWSQLAHNGKPERPVALMLSPSAADALGDQFTWAFDGKEVIDTWAWGWMIRMSDGSFRP